MKALLGKKIGMTQVFDAEGKVVPVTVLQAGPCVVVQKKTKEKDGYNALQLGFGSRTKKRAPKAIQSHVEKCGCLPQVLKELRLDGVDISSVEVGQKLCADVFAKDELVNVQGQTIGKGFQGGIKRWNFNRQRMTHGCKARRLPGSMAAMDRGGKIPKGKRMAGHLGDEKVTIKNLKIAGIDGDIMMIRGAIPGPKNGIVIVYNRSVLDVKKFAGSTKPVETKAEAAPVAAPAAVEEKKA